MTNIKRLITFILTIAMFAIMSTNAFALNGVPFPRTCYMPGETQSSLIAYYSTRWLAATNFVDESKSKYDGVKSVIEDAGDTGLAAQLIYHATHDCGWECSNRADGYIPSMELGDETQHHKNVVKYADAMRAEFGTELTRAELAVIVYRAAIENGFTGNPNITHIDLPDIGSVDSETATAIQFAMDNGLMLWTRDTSTLIRSTGDYKYLPELGFRPDDVANFGDIVGAAMFLHYAVNDASGFNARTMDYSYDGVEAARKTVYQCGHSGRPGDKEDAIAAYYANMDAYKTK